jgi:hypothetical protein
LGTPTVAVSAFSAARVFSFSTSSGLNAVNARQKTDEIANEILPHNPCNTSQNKYDRGVE